MNPSSLLCEYFSNPVGLDVPHPRLSWMLPPGERRGIRQTAYRILVASSPWELAKEHGDLWDSGRVESDASVHVRYAGNPLASKTRCFWKVQVWDETGAASGWSEVAYWEMGLLERDDWKAEWIGSPLAGGQRTGLPVPYLRKEFAIDREIVRARLYVTARGLFEFSLNGQRVGDEVLAPGWTDYSKRIAYHVHDVTSLLRKGANAAGALLGDGWYCGNVAWLHRQMYGERPSLLAQLEVEFADGTRDTIVSDSTWKTAFGPILGSDMQMGEVYDARREMPGWDCAGFDDSVWWNVLVIPDTEAARVALRGSAIKRQNEIKPVSLAKDKSIFDLGQNMVGWVRLKITAPAGTVVDIRHGEMLDKDGSLYTANLRSARATDYYTCKGGGEEVWEPRFTFHGFRYVQVGGFPGEIASDRLTLDMVTGIVVHSDMPLTGEFDCSEPLVNQLQKNILWGQRGNFLDVPTDCPQRDERMGWLGDAQVFARTAAFNFNVAPFFTKWQDDLADSQSPTGSFPMVAPDLMRPDRIPVADPSDGGPAWADAGVICPWTVYLCYGDTGLLAGHYESLKRFIASLKAAALDGIRSHPDKYDLRIFGAGGFGDWLALDGSQGPEGKTPKDLIGTAFYAYSVRLLGKIATTLCKADEATEYEALFEAIRAAYQRRFIDADGVVTSGTQTSLVLTLQFDLAPESMRPKIVDALVRNIENNGNKLSTGFVGTAYLPHALTGGGRVDAAYKLLLQEGWPSWLYAVTQGATTIWERWDGWTREKGFQNAAMNSFNHYAFGAIGEWLYSTVAGLDIDPAAPGYKHAIVKPQPGGGLTRARASLETLYGKLSSEWKIEGNVLNLQVTIPPNTTATVCVPAAQDTPVTEGGTPAANAPGVKAAGWENGAAVYRVGSGCYEFAVRLG